MFAKQIEDAIDFASFDNLEIKKAVLKFVTTLENDLDNLEYSMGDDAESALKELESVLEDVKESLVDELDVEVDEELDDDLKPDFELDDDKD